MSRAAIAYPPFLARLKAAPGLKSAGMLEAIAAGLMLLLYSQGLIGPLFADPADPESSAILRLIWLPVYALTLVLLLLRPGATLVMLSRNLLLMALIVLALVSTLWSVAPDDTLRRAFALAMTTAFGLWLAARFAWAELVRIIASVFGLLAVLSTFMALFVPAIGVDQLVHAGAWKGVWWEKNTLGAMMAFGSVACLAAMMNDPARRWLWAALAVLCTALVLLSTSKTALLAWTLGVGGLGGIAISRSGFGFAALTLSVGLTGGVLVVLVLMIAPVEAVQLLGRDATLTGRTDIWVVLLEQIRAAPWTGYGYKAYWVAENGPVFWVRQATAWDVPTAHNGWIEIGLALGLPGIVLMALVYVRGLLGALGRVFAGAETYWALPIIAMIGLVSISESNLLQQNDLSWVLLIATCAKLAGRRA